MTPQNHAISPVSAVPTRVSMTHSHPRDLCAVVTRRHLFPAWPAHDEELTTLEQVAPVCAKLANYAFGALALTHSVETDLGRVMAVPMARFKTSWANMPIARETENSTV